MKAGTKYLLWGGGALALYFLFFRQSTNAQNQSAPGSIPSGGLVNVPGRNPLDRLSSLIFGGSAGGSSGGSVGGSLGLGGLFKGLGDLFKGAAKAVLPNSNAASGYTNPGLSTAAAENTVAPGFLDTLKLAAQAADNALTSVEPSNAAELGNQANAAFYNNSTDNAFVPFNQSVFGGATNSNFVDNSIYQGSVPNFGLANTYTSPALNQSFGDTAAFGGNPYITGGFQPFIGDFGSGVGGGFTAPDFGNPGDTTLPGDQVLYG